MNIKIALLILPVLVILTGCTPTTNTDATDDINETTTETTDIADTLESFTDIPVPTVETLENEYPEAYTNAKMPEIANATITQARSMDNSVFVDYADFYKVNPPKTTLKYLLTIESTDEVGTVTDQVSSTLDGLDCEKVISSSDYTAGIDCYANDYSVAFLIVTKGSEGGTQVTITFNDHQY